MKGFVESQALNALYDTIKEWQHKAVKELTSELNSPGYKRFFEYVKVKAVGNEIEIDFKKTEELEKTQEAQKKEGLPEQDIPSVLAEGGSIKLGDTFIGVDASPVLRKYLR